jgi:hypothetical protein
LKKKKKKTKVLCLRHLVVGKRIVRRIVRRIVGKMNVGRTVGKRRKMSSPSDRDPAEGASPMMKLTSLERDPINNAKFPVSDAT